jgi:hypothetical protein
MFRSVSEELGPVHVRLSVAIFAAMGYTAPYWTQLLRNNGIQQFALFLNNGASGKNTKNDVRLSDGSTMA